MKFLVKTLICLMSSVYFLVGCVPASGVKAKVVCTDINKIPIVAVSIRDATLAAGMKEGVLDKSKQNMFDKLLGSSLYSRGPQAQDRILSLYFIEKNDLEFDVSFGETGTHSLSDEAKNFAGRIYAASIIPSGCEVIWGDWPQRPAPSK